MSEPDNSESRFEISRPVSCDPFCHRCKSRNISSSQLAELSFQSAFAAPLILPVFWGSIRSEGQSKRGNLDLIGKNHLLLK